MSSVVVRSDLSVTLRPRYAGQSLILPANHWSTHSLYCVTPCLQWIWTVTEPTKIPLLRVKLRQNVTSNFQVTSNFIQKIRTLLSGSKVSIKCQR